MSSIDVGAAIYIALKPILKIYTIIFVGYLLAKFKIVTMETARGISNMVVNAILPCLTFNKIVTNISWRDIKEIGVIVLSALILFSLGTLCALVTNYVTPVPKKWFWGIVSVGLFPNISDLPIAYVQSMGSGAIFSEAEADKGVAYSCIFLFTQSFLMMNFGLWRLIGLDFRDKDHKKVEDVDTDLEEGSNLSDAASSIIENNGQDNTEKTPTLSRPEPAYFDPSIVEEHEMSSIDSEAFISDDASDNNSNSSVDKNSHVGKSQFDYIRPFEDHHRSSKSKERSHSTSMRIHPDLNHVLSSPSILENREEYNLQRRGSMGSFSIKRRRGSRNSTTNSVNEMVAEYSVVNKIRTGEIDLDRPLTVMEDVGAGNSRLATALTNAESDEDANNRASINTTGTNSFDLDRIPTAASDVSKHTKRKQFIKKYHLGWLVYFGVNFIRPASLGALLGIICALIPWVKACFVNTYVHVHNAPDGKPVLNFLMDFTGYIGNACVPLGLLLLGGTLARLQVSSLPKGFVRSAIMMSIFRLVVLPIIGIAWANKIYDLNWLDNRMSKFIMILTWSMPSATSQVYFTAFYTPLEGEHIQMDCLSVFFFTQYSILFITLSIVVTYTLKVELHV
ncbi:protein Ecm3p [Monosporozyma servazzii]